jgi:hypothetical protein
MLQLKPFLNDWKEKFNDGGDSLVKNNMAANSKLSTPFIWTIVIIIPVALPYQRCYSGMNS